MKTLSIALTIALAVLAVNAAHARPTNAEAPSRVINFADLNLDSPAGIAKLRARIRAAAQSVCGRTQASNLLGASRARACALQAELRAIASLNIPALSRLTSSAKPAH